MKPNFALTLSFNGIGLLHRSTDGWQTVGDVPLDHPDLPSALRALADKANMLDEAGITTKLVVPNQQIRFLSFDSDSRDVDILEAQVRNTLAGATPYHISELAYDWSMAEGRVCVAAVAIETLTEAESFAIDHGFSPLSFVAVPEDGDFAGEPFFGETVFAGDVLKPGDSVERDEKAIVVTGAVAADPVVADEALAQEPEPDPQPAPEDDTTVATLPSAPIIGFQSSRGVKPIEDAPRVDEPTASEVVPEPLQDPLTSLAQDDNPPAEPAPTISFHSARRPQNTATSAETALPRARFAPGDESTSTAPPEPEKAPIPPTQSKAPPAKLKEGLRPIPPIPPAPELPDDEAQKRADTLKEQGLFLTSAELNPVEGPDGPASTQEGRLPFLSQRRSDAPAPPRPKATTKATKPAAKNRIRIPGREGFGLGIKSGLQEKLSRARSAAAGLKGSKDDIGGKPAVVASTIAPAASATSGFDSERERMTVFGARNPASSTPESNSRFVALAVTAALLLFLVGVAAWAAVFLDGGLASLFRSSDDVQVAEEPAAIEAPAALPDDPEIAAIPQAPARDTEDLADEPLATLDQDSISEELSPDEARRRYAATGIWQRAPVQSRAPFAVAFQEVYQTSLDPDVNFSDAVALPDVALLLSPGRPAVPTPALPPGSDIDLDERGFVRATPEGAITPEGIPVIAGAPPLSPPRTPDRPDAPEPDTVENVAVAAIAPDDSGLRPRVRPEDLSEGAERANNNGRTLLELQDARPRARPQSPQERASEEAGVSTVIEEDVEDPLADATDEAVSASLKPRQRPSNFAQVVEETRETAAAEPVSIEQRVAVSIPTTASVARAATERNQISLRRVNLIGVYGSEDARRALVRLPSGRYKKVQVGDRLDGGQVSAIGSDELRYTKRGQSVVLRMPSG